MKDWLTSEVKWGPSSVLLGLGALLSAAIFTWQLIETGDPAEAGTRTSAIFAAVFGAVRTIQAVWKN